MGVTASTGMAASCIGGHTLHYYLGFGPNMAKQSLKVVLQRIRSNAGALQRWRRLKVLVIDESTCGCARHGGRSISRLFQVSLIDADTFDRLVKVGGAIFGASRSHDPFGGIQARPSCTPPKQRADDRESS